MKPHTAHRREHVEVGRQGRAPTPRSAPGRCPCRCSRAPRRRRRTRAPPATRWREITGRDSADTSGYLPSYRALAWIAGTRKSSANSARASTTAGLDGAGRQRPLADDVPRVVGLLADVDRERDDLGAPLLLDPLHRHRRVETAGVREHHSLGHASLSSCLETGQGGQLGGDGRAAVVVRAHHDDRVVAGHRAEHVGKPARSRAERDDVGRAGRRPQHHEVRASARPRPRTPPSPVGGGRRARPASLACSGIA